MRNAMLLAATALAGLPRQILIADPAVSTRRQVTGSVAYRPISTSSYDQAARTVDLIAATETPVRMPGWRIGIEGDFLEVLGMEGADISAVAAGNVPLIDSHDMYSGLGARLGLITAARVDGARLVTTAKFGDTDQARSAEAEVGGQTPPKVSIGYRVAEYQFVRFEADRTPVYRATRWQLSEVSLVPKAADPNAGVRSTSASPAPCVIRGDDAAGQPGATSSQGGSASVVVHTAPQAADLARAATPAISVAEAFALQDQARALGVETQTRAAFDAPNATATSIGAAILAAAATRQAANTGAAAGAAGHVTRDAGETQRQGVQDALLLGLGGQPRHRSTQLGRLGEVDVRRVEAAREFRSLRLSEMAAIVLGERAMPRTAADVEAIFARAFHVTSDFPTLLTNALNQRLLENYTVATPIYRRICQQITFADFRSHGIMRVGDFPTLQQVNEAGEIKGGTIHDAKKENLTVTAYGVAFNLSRQLLVNDRLGGIEQALASQGTQVALFEEKTFFNMKNVSSGIGPTLNEDSTAVFAAGHNNYTSSGTAISTASISVGRALMRKQKNLQGDQMGLGPSLLLATPDNETAAQQALVQVAATQGSNVNLFAGSLELIVGGQLNGTAWELYGNPGMGANWAWGLLEGYEAPRLKVEEVFGAQGVKVSLEHDFGCGAIDFRFGYRNVGA